MSRLNPFLNKILFSIVAVLCSSSIYAQQLTDRSIKTNITAIHNPLQKLVQLTPQQFEYNTQGFKYLKLKEGAHYGFMAEDIQAIFPHLVNEKSVTYSFGKNVYRNAKIKTIDEAGLIPVLVASIKEQQVEIEKLKVEIAQLKHQTAFND
jgi:hypothetical protein